MKNNKKYCVLYGVDNNIYGNLYCLNSILSLNDKTHSRYDVIVITDKNGNNYLDFYKEIQNVRILQLGEDLKLNVAWAGYATWYRFYCLINNAFQQYDKVLYLDCDTTIHKDINDIFEFNDAQIYAITESKYKNKNNIADNNCIGTDWMEHFKHEIQQTDPLFCINDNQQINKYHKYEYFNAGVFLINLYKINNRQYIYNKILEIAKKYNFHDQHVLNFICFNEFLTKKELSTKFNLFWPTDKIEHIDINDVIITHNTGGINKFFDFQTKNNRFISKFNKLINQNIDVKYLINTIPLEQKIITKEYVQECINKCNIDKDNLYAISIDNTNVCIYDNAFKDLKSLTEIKNANNILSIGKSAFKNCINLKYAFIDNCSLIDDYAFDGCEKLEEVHASPNKSYLGNCAFRNCVSLNIVWNEHEFIHIGDSAFENCKSLSTWENPKSNTCKYIGINAFANTKYSDIIKLRTHSI